MNLTAPALDHVVVDVRENMDEAVGKYCALGFQLTGRGYHTLGSINHLAVFESNYIELLGFNGQAQAARADIASFPVGVNGLVFAGDETENLYHDLQSRGVPVDKPAVFSRPLNLPEGTEDVKFQVVRLHSGAVSFGRVYFCHHLTPQLVWRQEWRVHANGAKQVTGVILAARDPGLVAKTFEKIFNQDTVRMESGGTWTLSTREGRIEIVTPAVLDKRFGDAAPDPAGRPDYMAVLRIQTASLLQTASILQSAGMRGARVERQRILVPASEAMNVAIEFEE